MDAAALLSRLGISPGDLAKGDLVCRSPIDGGELGRLPSTSPEATKTAIDKAHAAFLAWRQVPAPRRGELVRLFGEELRAAKEDLGQLVTLEAGKIVQEGQGEVQEMIDICDFAVGLSRQLYGLTIASERPGHRMMETWHPLGVCGVISAFNFPVAVWSWNAALALVSGDSVLWKPSEKTSLTALACARLFGRAAKRFGGVPDGLLTLILGGAEVGRIMAESPKVPVVSATGSTRMGKAVAETVARRLGRSILELGGNNAMIVAPSADQELAIRGILFSAVGTAGQRCTTLRRLIVHESIHDGLVERLRKAYASVRIGDPREAGTLVGPLIDKAAYDAMQATLTQAKAEGGQVFGGERQLENQFPGGYYVRPALASMPRQTDTLRRETFAPILYTLKYREFAEAVALNNDVPQGLASSVFTTDMREAETFMADVGSDCGIANVNIGPSGAEIGGAFGGEKETGGGRESGSDAWKGYMRRATNTINYSRELPLAQGIKFEI